MYDILFCRRVNARRIFSLILMMIFFLTRTRARKNQTPPGSAILMISPIFANAYDGACLRILLMMMM